MGLLAIKRRDSVASSIFGDHIIDSRLTSHSQTSPETPVALSAPRGGGPTRLCAFQKAKRL